MPLDDRPAHSEVPPDAAGPPIPPDVILRDEYRPGLTPWWLSENSTRVALTAVILTTATAVGNYFTGHPIDVQTLAQVWGALLMVILTPDGSGAAAAPAAQTSAADLGVTVVTSPVSAAPALLPSTAGALLAAFVAALALSACTPAEMAAAMADAQTAATVACKVDAAVQPVVVTLAPELAPALAPLAAADKLVHPAVVAACGAIGGTPASVTAAP